MGNDIASLIKEKGYWLLKDPDVGARADQFLKPRIDTQSVEALKLAKIYILDNKQNEDIIDAIFDEPVIVFYRGFGQTKRVHCFRNNVLFPIAPNTLMMVFGFCSTASKILLCESSHLYPQGATNAPNGVLGIPDETLERLIAAGEVQVREESFEQGGYIISDGRIGWKVLQGKTAFLGIMEIREARNHNWVEMDLPRTEEHINIVETMKAKNKTLCANFRWLESA
ncbi:hypothetical protein V2G26_021282 [Clonostachys chloroleuca]